MHRTAVSVLGLLASLVVAAAAHATTFSVLLGDPQDPEIVCANPLYQGSGASGDNPLFEGKNLRLSPGELWPGAPATVEVLFNDSLPNNLPAVQKGALVFGVSLIDQATGNAIHQLNSPVTLTIEFDHAVKAENYVFSALHDGDVAWGRKMMGNPKIGEASMVCGTTDHFSFFYIAAVPEPSMFALAIPATAAALAARRRRR